MRKLNLVVVEQLQEILEIGFQFHVRAFEFPGQFNQLPCGFKDRFVTLLLPEIDIELPVWKPAPDNPAHGGSRAHAPSPRTEGIRQTAPI